MDKWTATYPEANSDYRISSSVSFSFMFKTGELTHRSNTNKRGRNTSIQSLSSSISLPFSVAHILPIQLERTYPNQTLSGNSLPNNIHSPRVDALLSSLQPNLHQIKWMPNNNSTNTTGTTGSEGPDLSEGLVDTLGGGLDFFDVVGHLGRRSCGRRG